MASAGRILIMPKGAYNASTTYEMLDMVSHNGSSWVAKKTTKGVEPSTDSAEHWQQMSDLSFLDEKKQDKEKQTVIVKAGESYKYTFTYAECCLLCAFFDNMAYSAMFACCGINEWAYNIVKLSETVYNASLGSTIGSVSGEDRHTITFINDTDSDQPLQFVKLPFYK